MRFGLRRVRPKSDLLGDLLRQIWIPAIARLYCEDGELHLSLPHWQIEVSEPLEVAEKMEQRELVNHLDQCVVRLLDKARTELSLTG